MRALKKNEEVVETLGERILGRIARCIQPILTEELLVAAGEEITEKVVDKIEVAPIDM